MARLWIHVRANRLKLKELENRIIMDPYTDELHQLSCLWADDRTKAAVYAIKAVTFSCFGPWGTQKAIEAFKNALELVQQKPSICTKWQKFDWLWSCAFNMSRQTRQTPGLEANEEELRSWQEVVSWMDSNKLEITETLFYAHYAEAIMIKTEERKRCEEILVNVFRLWKKLDFNRKLLYNLVIIIAQKFCRTHPKHGFEVRNFVEEIDVFEFVRDDLKMYRRFTKFMNYTNENGKAIEILEKAEKKLTLIRVFTSICNFWIDGLNRSLKNGYTLSTLVYSKNIQVRVQVCVRSFLIELGGYSIENFFRF